MHARLRVTRSHLLSVGIYCYLQGDILVLKKKNEVLEEQGDNYRSQLISLHKLLCIDSQRVVPELFMYC